MKKSEMGIEQQGITQEGAVSVMAWLKVKRSIFECNDHRVWLLSPEGERAIMDKLGEEKVRTYIVPQQDGGTAIFLTVGLPPNPDGVAPTRKEALILAVLEMLK